MSNIEITYKSFINRISATARKDFVSHFVKNIFISLLVFIGFALVLVLLESLFNFSSTVRKFIFFGFFSSFFATITFTVIGFIIKLNSAEKSSQVYKYAQLIGAGFPDIKDNLLNSLQIYETSNVPARQSAFRHAGVKSITSKELVGLAVEHTSEKTKDKDFGKVISFKKSVKAFLFFTFAFCLFTFILFIFPSLNISAQRLIDYNYTFVENTLCIRFEVTPGNAEVQKGENVSIDAKIFFNDPLYKTDEIKFYSSNVNQDGYELSSKDEKVKSVSENTFKTTLNNISAKTIYWFEFKGIKSESFTVNVLSSPVIKTFKLVVYPPAYSKLRSRTVEGNEVSTLEGSTIYFEGESSDELKNGELIFVGGNKITLETNGHQIKGSFTATSNSQFSIGIKNQNELVNKNSPTVNIKVFPDEYPKISIVEPNSDMVFGNEKEVMLRSRISDDFGFTKMRLGYRLSKSKYGPSQKDFSFVELPLQNKDATGVEVPYLWNLASLNPGTEDEFEYFVEVYDNDGYKGPKMSKSEIRKLIYPSLEALLQKTEKSKEEIEKDLKSAYEDALELKKNLDELKEKLNKKPEELGLNDPKKNMEMQNKIDNIQNQFNSAQQKLDNLMNELQQNNQLSKETLQKYMELQKMFQQIDSKELREMLQKLREAMKNMNKDQLQEAMNNFKFDEENFKKSLEKTMELLNKIMNEQKFGELTQKLDEITKKQDEVKEQTNKTNESDKNKMNEISKTQEQLKNEMEKFQEEMKKLTENMKKFENSKISKELEKLLNEMMKKKLDQKMNESSKNLEQGNKNKSQKNQEQLSMDLNQLNQQMQDLLGEMLEMENSKTMEKMNEFLERLQKMSQKEGELKDNSEDLDKNSSQSEFNQNKKEQEKLANDLSNTIEEMMSMGQEMGMTPMMAKNLGDAYNDMNKASDKLGSKDGNGANKSQGSAKENLDKAISKLQSMCQDGNKPGNGKKPGSGLQQLMQMLSQMIQKQQQLNQQMGMMGQQGNDGKLTQEQMAQMQKLSMEQETIRKNLEQMNEQIKKDPELEGKKMLGNLEQIQKDMMEVIKDLENNNITPETKKRQEKILSRMLDFQLSAREKDFEQKRESRSGKNFDRNSPPEVVFSKPNIIDGINQDALEMEKLNYSEDYERLIQKYMEKMKNR